MLSAPILFSALANAPRPLSGTGLVRLESQAHAATLSRLLTAIDSEGEVEPLRCAAQCADPPSHPTRIASPPIFVELRFGIAARTVRGGRPSELHPRLPWLLRRVTQFQVQVFASLEEDGALQRPALPAQLAAYRAGLCSHRAYDPGYPRVAGKCAALPQGPGGFGRALRVSGRAQGAGGARAGCAAERRTRGPGGPGRRPPPQDGPAENPGG